jgi:nitroreductase
MEVKLMNFLELAKKRYAVRNFLAKKVEQEKLKIILEAGRVAPTGANMQPQELIVVQEISGLEKLKLAANVYGAPLAIIICGNKNSVWKRSFDGKNLIDIDTSIVTDHMMLQATELGLGTIWVCYFKPDVIRKEFNLPEHIEPINILGIGYASGKKASPDRHDEKRKSLDKIVSYETFQH